jgi:hypothetical protein
MAKPKMNGGMKVALGQQFWVIPNPQIPLSRAARRAIRAYREKKPGGFDY